MKNRSFIRRVFHRFYIRHWPGFNPFKLAEWGAIDRDLHVTPGMHVLDVACGGGYFTRRVRRKGARKVVGVDLSEEGIQEAYHFNRDAGMHFFMGNAMCLPFMDDTFDAVISVCSFEHFADDIAALREVARVLKLGGSFVLTVDSLSYKGISPEFLKTCCKVHHVERYYTLESARLALEKAGFQVEAMEYLFNSIGSSLAFKVFTYLHWRGIDLLDPFLYPFLRPLAFLSDQLFGRNDGGYAIAIAATLPMRQHG